MYLIKDSANDPDLGESIVQLKYVVAQKLTKPRRDSITNLRVAGTLKLPTLAASRIFS